VVVIDGADPLDAAETVRPSPRTLLVVPWGIPRTSLQRLAAEYPEGELDAVVLFRTGRVRRRRR
jgi:hypothetical protein